MSVHSLCVAHRRPSRGDRCALLLCLILACVAASARSAEKENPDRLLLSALTQEGDLLLEERKPMEPIIATLLNQKLQLAVDEKAILVEVEAVKQGMAQYNAAVDQMNEAVRQHDADCSQSLDRPALQKCNDTALELRTKSDQLAAQMPALNQRHNGANERIVRYNAAAADWNKRSNASTARSDPNLRDIEQWLVRFREFLASDSFAAVSAPPAKPVCSDASFSDASATPPDLALRRALDCLRSLKPT
ncbi:MAG: hypothetical protein ABI612_09275 [Betaproteobacteria bacterium]